MHWSSTMNNNLNNWLSSVKSDDIDGGLAADFDGSLSGLGVELGANTYNMSEALLALPSVFKQENSRSVSSIILHNPEPSSTSMVGFYSVPGNSGNEGSGSTRSLTVPLFRTVSFPSSDLAASSPHSLSLPSLCGSQNVPGDMEGSLVDADNMNSEWVSLMTSMKLAEVDESISKPRFQYILNASTSPATRMSEETLTYLNQGQPYEITLKQMKDSSQSELPLLKSIIRVVFHEKKLQCTEKEQLETWRIMRPGERIIDVDLPLSHGIVDVKTDPQHLNCIEFVWDPNSVDTTSIFIKVNCVSSEFTAKKHGGEKGVPFRIRAETYSNNVDEESILLHAASCQVKIFKPKGADRKNKIDKEKIEKQTESEKGKFQPAFNCTVLTENKEPSMTKLNFSFHHKPASISVSTQPVTSASQSPASMTYQFSASADKSNSSSTPTSLGQALLASTLQDQLVKLDETSNPLKSKMKPPALSILPANTLTNSTGPISRKRPLETSSSICSPHSPHNFNEIEYDSLLPSSPPEEVVKWLLSNRFHDFVETFNNFSGSDLLCLHREDLIQICGIANGIRLHNTLQAKSIQPRLTLYVCHASGVHQTCGSANIALSGEDLTTQDFSLTDIIQHSPVSSRSRSSTSSPISHNQNNQTEISDRTQVDKVQGDRVSLASCRSSHFLSENAVRQLTIGSEPSFSEARNHSETNMLLQNGDTHGEADISPASLSETMVFQRDGQHTNVLTTTSSFTCGSAAAVFNFSVPPPVKLMASKIRNKPLQFSPENRKKNDFKTCPSSQTRPTLLLDSGKMSNASKDFCEETTLLASINRLSSSVTPSTTSSLPYACSSNKRSISDKDEESFNQSLFGFKKQRMQNPEVVPREVFHAVYLESLTERHLAVKLAGFFSLHSDMISQILIWRPFGIFVHVDDKLVQNLKDSSSFVIEVTEDEDFNSFYKIILRPIET